MISVIISFILVIVGALNWLCVGFFQYDFVAGIFGTQASILSRIVYIVVGLASIWLTYAVIRYKATLQPMSKNVNHDMDKSLKKLHSNTVKANTEASEELTKNEHNNHHNKSNSKNQRFETSKYRNFDDAYTSFGYDYKNSRRDYSVSDEDEDID
ncbi:MAG: DUF378 domain-containing protein [Clostridia bacterium]|nr:DUF378 domain-containing protein [Clostridia bacterium]